MTIPQLKEFLATLLASGQGNLISGEELRQAFNAVIDTLSDTSDVALITQESVPLPESGNIVYIATEDGDYRYFGGLKVSNEIAFITESMPNVWHKQSYPIPAQIKHVEVETATTPDGKIPTADAEIEGNTLKITLYDIKGEKGEKGDKVDVGMSATVEQGDSESAAVVTITEDEKPMPGKDQSFSMTFRNIKGEQGKSAYEVWKENGHSSGTQEEFLQYLAKDWKFDPKAYYSSAANTIGGTCNKLASDFGVADAESNVVYLMPDAASDPSKTRMYILNEAATAFVYVGDMDINSSSFVKYADVDNSLTNPTDSDVAGANAVMEINEKLRGVILTETKVDTNNCIITSSKKVEKGVISDSSYESDKIIQITIPQGAKKIRFIGAKLKLNNLRRYYGYAFYSSSESLDNSTRLGFDIFYDGTVGSSEISELIIDIPDGAVTFVTTYGLHDYQVESRFYCYFQQGNTVSDEIENIENNLSVTTLENLEEYTPIDNCNIRFTSSSETTPIFGYNSNYTIHKYDVSEYVGRKLRLTSSFKSSSSEVFWMCFVNSDGDLQETPTFSSATKTISGYISAFNPLFLNISEGVEVIVPATSKYLYISVYDGASYQLCAVAENKFAKVINADNTNLVNPAESSVAKAIDVMAIKQQIGYDCSLHETKAEVIEEGASVNVYNGFIVCKTVGNFTEKTYVYSDPTKSVFIPLQDGIKRVRFLGRNVGSNGYSTGYAFLNIDDIDDIIVGEGEEPKDISQYIVSINPWINRGNNDAVEIIADVPEGANYFCTLITSTSVITVDNFYCYLQTGNSLSNEIKDKVSLEDFSEYWGWKKNLINKDENVTGYIYTESGGVVTKTNDSHAILSGPVYLKEGVIYTASNVNVNQTNSSLRKVGGTCMAYITTFDSHDNVIRVRGLTGVITKTDNNANKNTGTLTFKYTKANDNEAYVRFRLRYNAVSGDTTYDDWRDAQVEVGYEATTPAAYHSEKVFDIAKKSDVTPTILNILAIGNSNSQDSLAYVPYLLNEIAPDIRLNIDILYIGSSGIPNHINNFDNYTEFIEDTSVDVDSYYEYAEGVQGAGANVLMSSDGKSYDRQYFLQEYSFPNWRNTTTKTSIQQRLDTKKYDLILINATSFAKYQIYFIDEIVDYLSKMDNPYYPKFGIINPAISVAEENGRFFADGATNDETHGRPYPESNWEEPEEGSLQYRWKSQLEGAANVIDKTLCEFVIPVNAAICNALTVDEIKELGDLAYHRNNKNWIDNNDHTKGCYGYLRAPDGVHLQDGLPCQIAAYAFIYELLKILGRNFDSILGYTTVCDDSWLEDKKDYIPGMNPNENSGPSYSGNNYTTKDILIKSAAGWTDNSEDNHKKVIFAQKCALMAVKKPFEVTDMNDYYGVKYPIFFKGIHASRDTVVTLVNSGEGYSTEIHANEGYTISTVTVYMGGTNITDTVYNDTDHRISINNITGKVRILVRTVKQD